MSAALVALVILPALAALFVAGRPAGAARAAARLGLAGAAGAFVLAVVVTVDVVTSGPVSATVTHGGVGLYADRVAVVLLLLVTGVSSVVQAFAGRYMHGDLRADRFFVATGLLTTATAAMVTAGTLVGLAVAWSAAGVALCVLLGLYRGLPAAGEGVRRTVRAFAVADGALWLAVVIALVTWGDLDMRTLGTGTVTDPADATVVAVVSCLLVVAALGRSAQLPLQGWLPATLAAPTPVSALLHAGVINGGGILLVRLSPLFGASVWATHLAFFIGAATAVYGTALMLTKPDIKGALAHSTMGQMGFMIMTCGLGAFAAAIFHLVAHGMYKAALFLGSGGAVNRKVGEAKAPPVTALTPRQAASRAVAALLIPAMALVGATVVLPAPATGLEATAPLLVFAWATAAWAAWGWLRRQAILAGGLTVVAGSALGAFGYVALVDGAISFLEPALTQAGDAGASMWLLAPVVGALATVTVLRLTSAGRLAELRKSFYVLALSAGYVKPGRRHGRSARNAWRPLVRPELHPSPQGVRS